MLILAVYSIKDLLDLNETSYRICQDKRLPEHLEAIRALVPVSGGFILFLCSTEVKGTVHTPNGLIIFQLYCQSHFVSDFAITGSFKQTYGCITSKFCNFYWNLKKKLKSNFHSRNKFHNNIMKNPNSKILNYS